MTNNNKNKELAKAISDRLREIMDSEFEGSFQKFATAVAINEDTLRSILYGRISNPSIPTLNDLAEVTNINLHWLITGKGEKYINHSSLLNE